MTIGNHVSRLTSASNNGMSLIPTEKTMRTMKNSIINVIIDVIVSLKAVLIYFLLCLSKFTLKKFIKFTSKKLIK